MTALAGWTVVIWGSRIRNIATDDDLSGFALGWRLAAAIGFVVVGLAVVGFVVAKQDRLARSLAGGLAVVGIVWWLLRGIQTLLAGHDAGFKIVHTALAIVTIALSSWVLVTLRSLRALSSRPHG